MSEVKVKKPYLFLVVMLLLSAAGFLIMMSGGGIGALLSGVFGFYGYILFGSIFAVSLMQLLLNKKSLNATPILFFFLAITSFTLFMQVIFSRSIDGHYLMEQTSFSEYTQLCFNHEFEAVGGAMCGVAVKALYDFLGIFGCYSVLVLLLVSCVYLFINSIASGKLLKDRSIKGKVASEKKVSNRISGDLVEDEFFSDFTGKRKKKKIKERKQSDERAFNSQSDVKKDKEYVVSQSKGGYNDRRFESVKSDDTVGRTNVNQANGDNVGRPANTKKIIFGSSYNDQVQNKGDNNDIPNDYYTRAYENEKVNFFSADMSIPTAPKTVFPEDSEKIDPPKIVHESREPRKGVDLIEYEYRRRMAAATDRGMRDTMNFSAQKPTEKRSSVPLHKDLLSYKENVFEDRNLPPIINAEKQKGRYSVISDKDKEEKIVYRMNKYGFMEGFYPDGRKVEQPDNRADIINADDFIDKQIDTERHIDNNRENKIQNNSDNEVLFKDDFGETDSRSQLRENDSYIADNTNSSELSEKTKDLIISSIEDLRRIKQAIDEDDSLDEDYDDYTDEDEYLDQEPDIRNGRGFGASELDLSDLKQIIDEARPRVSQTNVSISEDSKTYSTEDGHNAVQLKVSEKKSPVFVERIGPYVPYKAPPLGLLTRSLSSEIDEDLRYALDDIGSQLVQTLKEYNIKASVRNIVCGPSVALYEMELATGISIKKVNAIGDDLARNISATGAIRIIPHIVGKNCFGLEVPLPSDKCKTVYLRDILESEQCKNGKGNLNIALGIDIEGRCVLPDLAKMPHLLIGGSTGSGKSVLMNSIIMSLVYKYSPEQLRFILVDPKRVEFIMYKGMPHMLIPEPINDAEKALNAFSWLCNEMERRYDILTEARVKNIDDYNKLIDKSKYQPMSRIVLMVDELCELTSEHKAELEDKIKRLTQLARAAGIHLILATQRPSVDVITGVIKSNLPSRVALKVTNYADSRTIIDQGGAEKLVQKGEMLFMMEGPLKRIQGPFVSDDEVDKVISYITENNSSMFDEEAAKIINTEKKKDNSKESEDEEDDILRSREKDPYFAKALKLLVSSGVASISMIQRNFNIGFNRANRLFGAMEAKGFIGKQEQNKPRQVLLTREKFNELYGDEFGRI